MTSPLNCYLLTNGEQAILKDCEVHHLIGDGTYAKVRRQKWMSILSLVMITHRFPIFTKC
jgi:hypothetical protein